MSTLEPVITAPLFGPLHQELLTLLRGLTPEEWGLPTSAGRWAIRDVAAHLVDVDLRKLSTTRDRHVPTPDSDVHRFEDLVRFLNGLNAEWIRAARRLSPRVLVDLLEFTGPLVAKLVADLPAHDASVFPVDWAGERASENWMDIGREYTERWHHQMQIREAADCPRLDERMWLHPVLALSVRAIPRAFDVVDAADGTSVMLDITGDAGDTWSFVRSSGTWTIGAGRVDDPSATITLDGDAAWRMFFNAPALARERAVTTGDRRFADALFDARAVMV